jgi:CubicO group peptidase (beta-lactamase class C family)
MTRLGLICSISLALLSAALVPASPAWAEELGRRFDAEVPPALARENIPGAVILVGHQESGQWVTWCRSYGDLQRLPEPRPMPENAIFDLASMTKPIATGTSLMILTDRGLVSVDDPVAKYLSEYDTPEKSSVTVRDLMTHCSGLPAYLGESERKPLIDEYGPVCPGPLRDYILNLGLRHGPPETHMVYSCLNAITTAMIVQRVSGQPLDEFAEENIFHPLGMADTHFSPGPSDRVVPTTEVSGEFLRGMVHDPLAHMQGGVSGNAGLFSSAQDISRFAQMMLQDGERDGVRILSEKAVAEMTRDQSPVGAMTRGNHQSHRGLLWDLYLPTPGDVGLETVPGYGHTGYTGTAIRLYPSQKLYIIALTNRVHPDDTARVAAFRHLCWVTTGEVVLGLDDSIQVLKDASPLLAAHGG